MLETQSKANQCDYQADRLLPRSGGFATVQALTDASMRHLLNRPASPRFR
ncbi:UNVERIFIED_ORG: hypothetical protein QOE_0066 [Clostridioides difficile F501]